LLIVSLEARLLAYFYVGIAILIHISEGRWAALWLFVACVVTAWAFVRYETGHLKLPRLPSLPKRAPASKSARGAAAPAAAKPAGPSVDDILDKISAQGMHSLTAEERQILDEASQNRPRRKK